MIRVKLMFKDNIFVSRKLIIGNNMMQSLKWEIQKALSGNLDCGYEIEGDKETYFFGNDVLKQSVIIIEQINV